MGYVDALRRYRELSSMRRQLLTRLLADRPDVFIGVDAPDYNLWLERRLKENGVPVVHYVSPSIWAWRGKRVFTIKRSTDHVLCLFPFEPEIYERHGVSATFVGHPLADTFPLEIDQAEVRNVLALPVDKKVVAVLPGSRAGEVERLSTTFIEAICLIHQRCPDALFLVPLVTARTRALFLDALRPHGETLPIRLMFGHSHEAMAAADVVLVASGTATLEAALLKRPMVIAYRLADFSYQIMKRLAYLPWVGLPNILAREALVPEFIQNAATPTALAEAVVNLLSDMSAAHKISERFNQIHLSLRQNAAEKAASVIEGLLRLRSRAHGG
jgi:lipid-A-disaccharide synthase